MRCARRLNAAAKYTRNCVPVEEMHAHHFSLELHHGNIHEEPFMPFRLGVDITDLECQFSFDQGLQLLDQVIT